MSNGKWWGPPVRVFSRTSNSIQWRLTLLICLLLLTVVLAYSWVSYTKIKQASIDVSKTRLESLSTQLGSIFGQSAQSVVSATRVAAAQPAIKQFLQSRGKDSVSAARKGLQLLLQDTTWTMALLTTANGEVLLSSDSTKTAPATADIVLNLSGTRPDTGIIGKIYHADTLMYYPVAATVFNGRERVGYLVRWRRMQTSPQAVLQFSQLLGEDVKLFIGNADGSLWTDMQKPVGFIPADLQQSSKELPVYKRSDGQQLLASVKPVNHTKWRVMTERPYKKIIAPASAFLQMALSTGIVIIAIGALLAWMISRSITRPLQRLAVATTAIEGGNYATAVSVESRDELGQLARMFNAMTEKVQLSQKNLEEKVQRRTAQLEATNQELEAFSYSVSHDLRAPLRAVSGYAMILKEDYTEKLDEEGNRILHMIVSNARMMGLLIDDLITFSKIGRKESQYRPVDMKLLVESCIQELQPIRGNHSLNIKTGDIAPCYGDGNLLKQVWMNLISNAIKYSSKEQNPVIEIGSRTESDRIIYFVRDNGVGFDMKYADKLFGVFERLHSQDEFEGTGIGLALSKRIIHKQGGEIWAEATKGFGATFYFSIPATGNTQNNTQLS
ncbi:MAG: ATP-binding protein [Chitinophagaceae bacterium]